MTLLTTKEAAAKLGFTTARIRQLCQDETLTARRIGRDWMIPAANLRKISRQRAAKAVKSSGKQRLTHAKIMPDFSEIPLDFIFARDNI
jgi:excisionase family DNA binding protein